MFNVGRSTFDVRIPDSHCCLFTVDRLLFPSPVTIFAFTLALFFGSLASGFVGALTGLGGGVILIPFLVLIMGADINYAIGAALVSVIATSCGAAAAYVRDGYINTRTGMFLEMATTLGAVLGAAVALYMPDRAIAVIFGLVLLGTAWLSRKKTTGTIVTDVADPIAQKLRMDGSFPGPDGTVHYHVHNVPGGFGIMALAGALSGMLGIGSGSLKVLAMDKVMKLPFKVSTTTSNFMIGVTAAASAGIYLGRGYIDPGMTFPVVLGVLAGAMLGARILVGAKVDSLKLIFTLLIVFLGFQMIYQGVMGKL
jgi:uncharacterized membrane protein YfcA